jgi:hypothetical protein
MPYFQPSEFIDIISISWKSKGTDGSHRLMGKRSWPFAASLSFANLLNLIIIHKKEFMVLKIDVSEPAVPLKMKWEAVKGPRCVGTKRS